eukprot:scaffold165039_cov14-Tisochrysis_lutea.AAC.1
MLQGIVHLCHSKPLRKPLVLPRPLLTSCAPHVCRRAVCMMTSPASEGQVAPHVLEINMAADGISPLF